MLVFFQVIFTTLIRSFIFFICKQIIPNKTISHIITNNTVLTFSIIYIILYNTNSSMQPEDKYSIQTTSIYANHILLLLLLPTKYCSFNLNFCLQTKTTRKNNNYTFYQQSGIFFSCRCSTIKNDVEAMISFP